MSNEIGFCVVCDDERVMADVSFHTTTSGRNVVRGQCPACGTEMVKFSPDGKPPPTPQPDPTVEHYGYDPARDTLVRKIIPSGELIYLACPYTHARPEVREARYDQAVAATAKLLAKGRHVFAPIVYGHDMTTRHKLPVEWEPWEPFARAMLSRCTELLILPLDGWEQSKGIAAEKAIAKELNLPIDTVGDL